MKIVLTIIQRYAVATGNKVQRIGGEKSPQINKNLMQISNYLVNETLWYNLVDNFCTVFMPNYI